MDVDRELKENTSATGAAVGAALGTIVVYVAEVATVTDIPAAVEGATVVVVTYLLARLLPPR